MAKKYAYIRSSGMYVPEKVVTNHDLAKLMETDHDWIVKRSGIHERRYAAEGVATSDLALKATENMLSREEVSPEEIDCIIFATLSPDIMFPGTGVILQEKLGWSNRHIPCFDIRQQCSGFIYGLQMAQAFIEGGMYENVLVIGAELHSHGLDFSNRGRAVTVLFGDGAGVALISATEDHGCGILHTEVYSDGSGALEGVHGKVFDVRKKPIVNYDARNPEMNADLFPEMPSPKNLFANAVRRMTEVTLSGLKRLSIPVNQVDWLLPHQANMRINSMVAKQVGIPEEKVLYNIHKFGNTTAATIPLLLAEFTENGTIKRGDLIVMVGFGSGFTWGSAVIRY